MNLGLRSLARRRLGLDPAGAVLLVVSLGIAAALLGMVFPKVNGKALLQLPDQPAESIELATFKRVIATYGTNSRLGDYLVATGRHGSVAGRRLVSQARTADFWQQAISPVLPFSRRDQREFGDIKDAAAPRLLGIEISVDAPDEAIATEMIGILATYFADALIRERARAWLLSGKSDAITRARQLRADIVKAAFDIQLNERRIADMKALLAKYPEASRLDMRQIVSVSSNETGERFLSPMAQLIGFESAISQRRAEVQRYEREVLQKELLSGFFSKAESVLDTSRDVHDLVLALKEVARATFAFTGTSNDWAREVALRVDANLERLSALREEIGVRDAIQVQPIKLRSPTSLALVGLVAGLALLGGVVLARKTIYVDWHSEGEKQRVTGAEGRS